MNLEQNTQEVQQAIDCFMSCTTRFVNEAIETIDNADCFDCRLDTMEFLHSVCINSQLFTVMQILTEVLDLTSMSEILPYFQDNALSDLFFSSFMSEVVAAFIQMSNLE